MAINADHNIDIIDLFVERYRREYDYFYEVARIVSQKCDSLTAENGIRAIVTFRAKSPDRLAAKLRQRDDEKKYSTENEIRADIVDLSGVRVALYFPGDRSKIETLLRNAFAVHQVKQFPDKPKAPHQRFDGYHAEHYRVSLTTESLPDLQSRYSESIVEIQVASVLMHAWSEVEHDLSYKQLSGDLSQEEKSVLDGINGIVLSGEIFLERLQAAFEARVSRSGNVFTNQYELAAFLYDRLRSNVSVKELNDSTMGRIDVLFRLIQKAELITPDVLGPLLSSWNFDNEQRPLADQVIDHLLASRPNLYGFYIDLRNSGVLGLRSYFDGKNKLSPELIGRFLNKWIIIERFWRALSQRTGRNKRHSNHPPAEFMASLNLGKSFKFEFDLLRRIRNELVHGMRIPNEEVLVSADEDLEALLEMIATHEDSVVREAMEWARSGEPDRE